ncbi:MAG: hypothetical protein HQL63_06680 [Magnetococcales bacterium]|nr:hypothetical protein [Magnetococcales bacterium]
MKYVMERLQEPSTWRGMIMLATALGIDMRPELVTEIIATGTGLAGLVGMLTKG